MLHKETVTDVLFETLKSICSLEKFSSFRLVGGTAIALQIGHRRSIDIDLFSNEKVVKQNIAHDLENKFPDIKCFITQYGITARINDLKIDIFDDWMIPFRDEPVIVDGIKIASLKDLAAFKLTAFTERREKKDYIDLYYLFQKFGGLALLKEYHSYNPLLSAKSLLFALEEVIVVQENKSPMPDMIHNVSWKDIEKSMHRTAKEFLLFQNSLKNKS